MAEVNPNRGALARLLVLVLLIGAGAAAAAFTPLGDYLTREGIGQAGCPGESHLVVGGIGDFPARKAVNNKGGDSLFKKSRYQLPEPGLKVLNWVMPMV